MWLQSDDDFDFKDTFINLLYYASLLHSWGDEWQISLKEVCGQTLSDFVQWAVSWGLKASSMQLAISMHAAGSDMPSQKTAVKDPCTIALVASAQVCRWLLHVPLVPAGVIEQQQQQQQRRTSSSCLACDALHAGPA